MQDKKIAMGGQMGLSTAKRAKEEAELDRSKDCLHLKPHPLSQSKITVIKTKNIKQPNPADKTVYPHRDDLLTAIAKMKKLKQSASYLSWH